MRALALAGIVLLIAASSRTQAEASENTAAGQLEQRLAEQQERIEQLERRLNEQQQLLNRLLQVQERIDTSKDSVRENTPATLARSEQQPQPGSQPEQIEKRVEGIAAGLGGFRFSGDFRFRADVQARSSNDVAGPLQNIRSRYRLRLNVDKELDPHFQFHTQLSTGPLNNEITNDQDFAGIAVKHPLFIAEAYIDFHPTSQIHIRGGRMEEVFADNMRFLWDDDVRFNGFHQIVRVPLGANPVGLKTLELRAGEYILSNPNVAVLAPSSPFVQAGFEVGKSVRDANLFHPGAVFRGGMKGGLGYQITADIQLYRNPNEIQLASLATGFPVLVSNSVGIALSGPITGTGNATTTSGGAIFAAPNFQIARLAYRVEAEHFRIGRYSAPAWLDVQVSRNLGTGKLRDALMASANLGSVKKLGDTRFLYQFALKDANALISQFTDDDLGTGSGVNIAVHAFRFDLGLTKFLQWQNLLFIQNERRSSNPAESFFVPLQRGANQTYRYLGQLAFTF